MDILKYMEIPYMYNGRDEKGCDCYGLVRLVLKNEKEIELPLFENIDNLNEFRRCLNLFKPSINPVNFDIVLMKGSTQYITHLGILIDDHILHIQEIGISFVPANRLKPFIIRYYHPEIETSL